MDSLKFSTKMAVCALFCVLGFLGNWFRLTLFFNVDFLFGSFFTMLAIMTIGGTWGILVGTVAGTCTYFLWNHPWAIITFAAEATFVAGVYSRRKGNLVIYDLLYWVCLGMPLIYLFYNHFMGMQPQTTLLIMLKQPFNGLFNVLMASLAMILFQFSRRASRAFLSYNRLLFMAMVSLVLLPAAFLMVSGMRTYQEKRAQSLEARVSFISEATRRILADWIQEHHRNVQILSSLVGNPNASSYEYMQHYVNIIKAATPAFRGMGVFNQDSISVGYSPQEQDGKPTVGVDMSARSHIAIMQREKEPYITDVLMSKLGNPSPIVIFLAPILISGKYEGYCSGVVEVAQISSLLNNLAAQSIHITVVDGFNRTIVSTLPDLKTMDPFPRPYNEIGRTADSMAVLYRPDAKKNISFLQQWADSYFYRVEPLSESCRWKVIVEASCALLVEDISRYSLVRLGLLSLFILVTVALSHFLSAGFISGIARLQALTRSLPERLDLTVDIAWPRSNIGELAELSNNFREMAVALQRDIARRRQIEEELRYKNILLATQQEVSIEGILIVDAAGRIVSCNRRFIEIWGIPPELISNSEDLPILQFVSNQVVDPPSLVQIARHLYEQHREEIREERIFLADGRVTELYSAPMFGGDRSYLGRVWYFRDVTEQMRAESALKASEERFRSLIKMAPVPMGLVSRDGKMSLLNDRFTEVLGYTLDDLPHIDDWWRTAYPEQNYRNRIVEGWEAALDDAAEEGGFLEPAQFHVSCKDGRTRVMEISAITVGDSVLASFIDLSEHKRLEEALRKSKAKLEAALSSMTDAVFISDTEGVLIDTNEAFARFLRFKNKEERSMSLATYPDSFELFMDGRRAPPEMWPVRRALRGETAVDAEYVLRRRDTGETWIGSHSLSPIRDQAGAVVGAVVVARDITEQRRAEEELKESEEHYRSLFENMLNGYAYCRMHFNAGRPVDFTYLHVNTAFETLTGLSHVVGKKVSEVIPGITESDSELLQTYGRVALKGSPERFETYVTALDMWFELSVYCPQAEHFVAIFDVITERKKAETALLSSLEEKVSLLKEVHHRVKNNLQIVASLLSLQAGQVKDSQALEALQDTRNRVRSMALLHEVLYRSENLARINIAVYSREICTHLLRSLGASAPQVKMDNRIGPVRLPLEQSVSCGLIINELVANALKHAFPDGRSGTIGLELSPNEEGMLSLRITDDGVGLPPGFDCFRTATLGLRLVARLAAQLNGKFTVGEKCETGTSFQVVFPALENTLHGEL